MLQATRLTADTRTALLETTPKLDLTMHVLVYRKKTWVFCENVSEQESKLKTNSTHSINRRQFMNGNWLGSCNRPIVIQRKTGLVERLGPNVFAQLSRPYVRRKSPLVAEEKYCVRFLTWPNNLQLFLIRLHLPNNSNLTTASFNWALRVTYLALK